MREDINQLSIRLQEYAGAIAIEAEAVDSVLSGLLVLPEVNQDAITVSHWENGQSKTFSFNGDINQLEEEVTEYLDSLSSEIEAIREGVV